MPHLGKGCPQPHARDGLPIGVGNDGGEGGKITCPPKRPGRLSAYTAVRTKSREGLDSVTVSGLVGDTGVGGHGLRWGRGGYSRTVIAKP